jgi:hypothetical protein
VALTPNFFEIMGGQHFAPGHFDAAQANADAGVRPHLADFRFAPESVTPSHDYGVAQMGLNPFAAVNISSPEQSPAAAPAGGVSTAGHAPPSTAAYIAAATGPQTPPAGRPAGPQTNAAGIPLTIQAGPNVVNSPEQALSNWIAQQSSVNAIGPTKGITLPAPTPINAQTGAAFLQQNYAAGGYLAPGWIQRAIDAIFGPSGNQPQPLSYTGG